MQSNVRNVLSNIRGGLAGVFICLVLTILVYFIAFMVAFGNNTAVARSILDFEKIFFLVAHPFWTILLSYFLGGYFLFVDRSSINPDRGE
jgi:ABC-type Na+ efflux pump permease subunit